MNAAPETLLEWTHLTGPEVDALDRDRTVVVVSASPLEVHGPHLPLTTDLAESEGLLRATVRRVKQRRPEMTFVHLPGIWMAADVLPSVGSLQFRPHTLRRILEDLGRTLGAQGFRHLWVWNFHGGPRHISAIEHALHRVNRRHGTAAMSVFSLLLSRLTRDGGHDLDHVLAHVEGADPEALRGDAHGGYVETSMMLHLLGDRVRDPSALPRWTMEDWRAQTGGSKGPLAPFLDSYRFFGAHTYAGAPAGASAELGARFIEVLAGHAAEALEDVLDGTITPAEARSPLWGLRHVLMSRGLYWLFERLAGPNRQIW